MTSMMVTYRDILCGLPFWNGGLAVERMIFRQRRVELVKWSKLFYVIHQEGRYCDMRM